MAHGKIRIVIGMAGTLTHVNKIKNKNRTENAK